MYRQSLDNQNFLDRWYEAPARMQKPRYTEEIHSLPFSIGTDAGLPLIIIIF